MKREKIWKEGYHYRPQRNEKEVVILGITYKHKFHNLDKIDQFLEKKHRPNTKQMTWMAP